MLVGNSNMELFSYLHVCRHYTGTLTYRDAYLRALMHSRKGQLWRQKEAELFPNRPIWRKFNCNIITTTFALFIAQAG